MIETRQVKKMQSLYSCILLVLFLAFAPLSLWSQNRTISGIVIDETNEPVIGASVAIKNTTVGTITDVDGRYTIEAPSDATLVFKLIGYSPREEGVNGRSQINVTMNVDETTLDDVVVVGYGVQKKVTLTGAIAGVKGEDMIKTKNENPQNMLTGKIAGVRVWQKSSEPGTFNNSFDIRGLGAPLVVIDGIPRTTADFQRLNANDIEDISVLKDASAAIYGVRAANGVVLVTTKKGSKDGKTSVTYNGSYTLQVPSGMPKLADPYETMTLYNERNNNIKNNGSYIPMYGENWFEEFRNGTRRTTDWNSLIFASSAPQTQHDVSISGGSEKTQYYVGAGYLYQEGFFKTGDLNYEKFNVRSNITTKIARGLTLDLNLSGVLDERNAPYEATHQIIRSYWRQGVLFPAYADPENTMLSYEGLEEYENPVAFINSDVAGYRKYKQKYFQSSASLSYDLETITPALKGLSLKGLFSYDYRMDNNEAFRKEYYQYAYDKDNDVYNKQVYSKGSPSRMRREMYDKQQTLGQLLLNYNRTFGEHSVSGLLGWEGQKQIGDNFYAQRDLAIGTPYLYSGYDNDTQMGGMSSNKNDIYDYTYSAWIGRLNYAYGSRYLAEVQFRYDGSSKFTPNNRWGFFPSASLGWRVSEESFFKDIDALSFVNQLKFRASYGEMGYDGSLEYDWATGYEYPATNSNAAAGYYNQWVPGYMFGGNFVTTYNPLALPNLNSTWFTAKTLNVGVDFEGWNGLFGFSLDYFNRKQEGLFARNTGELPTVVGATAPRENLDSERHFGLDLEMTHRNKINDFSYRVKTIGTITRQKRLVGSEKGPWSNSYDRWRNDNLNNRYQGVQFGYESAGRYQNWQDIWSYPIYKESALLPGDYKYQDWNGDGQINGLDMHPYAFDQTPWFNYSFNFDLAYKNFDLNVLFQGSALGSMVYKEALHDIWGSNGGGVLEQYLDRWHPENPNADIYDPKTVWVSGHYKYTGRPAADENSEFNRVSTAYLRLKSIELGYTLPRVKALSSMNLRVFANAYNLFTITGVKFVDPEHPDDELGRLYPLNKTYTVGMSLTF